MAKLADRETIAILNKLKHAIEDGGFSLRRVAQASERLDPPERIHHSNLSEIFHRKNHRDLYLQAFLAICKLIGRDPIAVMLDDDAAALARATERLSKNGRTELLRAAQSLLDQEDAPATPRRPPPRCP